MSRRIVVSLVAGMLALLPAIGAQAATKEAVVRVNAGTGRAVPVVMTMNQLRDIIGVDFAANWDSLVILDADGNLVPHQVDDIDLSGALSGEDEISFLAAGNVRIELNDEEDVPPAEYPSAFTVDRKPDGSGRITTTDGQVAADLTPFGTVHLVKAFGKEETFVKEIGALRYAGFPNSRWYTEQDLKNHEEKTTYEEPLRIAKQGISRVTPVRVAVVNQVASDLFPGLRGRIVVSVFANGEVRADYALKIAAYTDFTKLMPFVSGVMAGASDAQHILPAFRWLDWADETGTSAARFFFDRDATKVIDGKAFIAFQDTTGPKPPFWGASYIFASPERWRTNYSASKQLGAAEIIPALPALPADLAGRLKAVNWHLEGEWRTGYFRWVADEVAGVRKQNNIAVDLAPTDMTKGDWSLHAQPGDTFSFNFVYSPYEAADADAAIRWLENRSADLASISFAQ